MKHILLISILLLFVHIDLQGQTCTEPIDSTVHKYKQLIIHGTHDNIFWSGDTLNILLEEIDHVTYNIVDNVPTFYNDPGIDTWIQCRLDTGATPAQLINEAVKAEPVIHHLMGKIYQGGLIFHMSPSGGGLVAHTSDASTTKNWFDAVTYCNTLSVTDAFSVT
ncbi:MAG TPA: hypothetical protein EYO58_12940, partial [Flavobacteriales bacterium]|nr:hypothetical protein [Flavobacteriales bacterium]